MIINELLLLSGNEIPFKEAQIVIHQPTIKEIAFIGEEDFYTGCEFLKFSKDSLEGQDRINLEGYSNFEVLMSIIKEKNAVIQKHRACLMMVLDLLFPRYEIAFVKGMIQLKEGQEIYYINNENFEAFKEILNQIFCLAKSDSQEYNPAGEAAKRIAEKLKKRHQKLAEEKSSREKKKIAILSRYVSILAVGESKDMNALLNYTVYQLLDEFKRYQLKLSNDIYFEAKLAGAQDLKEVDDWMKDIYEEKQE